MKKLRFCLFLCLIGAFSFIAAQAMKKRNSTALDQSMLMQIASRPNPPNLPAMQIKFEETFAGASFPQKRISTRRLMSISSDGSSSIIDNQYTNDGNLYLTHRHLKLKGGISADIIDNTKSVTAYRAKEPGAEDRRRALDRWNPSDACASAYNGIAKQPPFLRRESLLGYETIVFQSESKSAKITKWVAPQLGCLEIRRIAEFADANGAFTETSDLLAVEIKLQTPPKEVFEIPAGFDHVSPSERFTREVEYRGQTRNAHEMQQFVKLDEQYRQLRYVP